MEALILSTQQRIDETRKTLSAKYQEKPTTPFQAMDLNHSSNKRERRVQDKFIALNRKKCGEERPIQDNNITSIDNPALLKVQAEPNTIQSFLTVISPQPDIPNHRKGNRANRSADRSSINREGIANDHSREIIATEVQELNYSSISPAYIETANSPKPITPQLSPKIEIAKQNPTVELSLVQDHPLEQSSHHNIKDQENEIAGIEKEKNIANLLEQAMEYRRTKSEDIIAMKISSHYHSSRPIEFLTDKFRMEIKKLTGTTPTKEPTIQRIKTRLKRPDDYGTDIEQIYRLNWRQLRRHRQNQLDAISNLHFSPESLALTRYSLNWALKHNLGNASRALISQ
ncbi:hypothetical protein CPB84DRAFT_1854363 [Gymnopilus junonius]|uniref:Uncharacterized protein n=1 Tax=Gymnopilus junonius TaxID=109634 RepID=A0A9P5N8S4_GYMJU|nr:hypothetical protein CPB84DRAFT_1854363 [Gymnopilus junonius]